MFPNHFAEKTLSIGIMLQPVKCVPLRPIHFGIFLGGNAEDDDRDFAAGDFLFPCPCGGSIGSGDGSGVGGGNGGGHG